MPQDIMLVIVLINYNFHFSLFVNKLCRNRKKKRDTVTRLRNVAVMEAQPLTRVDKGELTWGSGGSFSAASPGTHAWPLTRSQTLNLAVVMPQIVLHILDTAGRPLNILWPLFMQPVFIWCQITGQAAMTDWLHWTYQKVVHQISVWNFVPFHIFVDSHHNSSISPSNRYLDSTNLMPSKSRRSCRGKGQIGSS